jgi:carbon monoxide dehydrogenase subunit G
VPKVGVTDGIPVDPHDAWAVVSDLSRLGEWLELHDGWRSEVPEDLAEGTELISVVSLKGMRNRVTWTIEEFRPPELIELDGDGKGGTKVSLRVSATPAGSDTQIELDVDFSNPALRGPFGGAAGRALKGALERSLQRLVHLTEHRSTG